MIAFDFFLLLVSQLTYPQNSISYPKSRHDDNLCESKAFNLEMQSAADSENSVSSSHAQSVDSGSGTDPFLVINSIPELSYTSHFDAHQPWVMAAPFGVLSASSTNISSVTPPLFASDRVHSQHDQPSNDATSLQRARDDRTPPAADQAKEAHAEKHDHKPRREDCPPANKVYDIPTLLRLKETQSAVPVMLRVRPEAIAGKCRSYPACQASLARADVSLENIFQYMGAATSRRQTTRSRGLSDSSNVSNKVGGIYAHAGNPTSKPKHVTQPSRQPQGPPETSIMQRHVGFARFLKQHASPPHHRVTAGGRIVPVGPTAPPPMLDFGSLNEVLQDRPATAKSFQKQSRSTQSNSRVQNPQVSSSMTLGDHLQSQGGSLGSNGPQSVAQTAQVQTAIPYNTLPFGLQPFMAPALQTQTPLVLLATLQDGSTIVSHGGMSYCLSWNGITTTMQPLQSLPPFIDQYRYPQTHPQGHIPNPSYSLAPQTSQSSARSGPLSSATNVARPNISKDEGPSAQPIQNGCELRLKTELTNLDKHLALYHYDITPVMRTSLISQRRHLVEEIDRIRLSKEKKDHSIPIIAPAGTKPPITPAAQLAPGTSSLHEAAQADQNAKRGTTRKHLSPAAPPFIPRNPSNLLPATFAMGTATQQAKQQESAMQAPSKADSPAPRTQDSTNDSTLRNDAGRKEALLSTRSIHPDDEPLPFNMLDPSDPAMRVIEYEDIEYAARYLYNWTKDTKTYCTTVSEFQEAVRRVREQARLYGCAGGQSKDPAYDAEQDIWWAICDRDPIPLPAQVPDHVANPRPWNWNDSAFNYRRQGTNESPGPGCEQARSSPRVLGWNPAMTDGMKDFMDVSRSYFALKRQLPSVSFRDFAYDRDGNKRQIQSDTAAPTAYATAPKYTSDYIHPPMPTSQRKVAGSSFDSNDLEGTSNKQLNVDSTGSDLDAQSKFDTTEKTPRASILPQEAPRTPEHTRLQQGLKETSFESNLQAPKQHVPAGHIIALSRMDQTVGDTHHACMEECPGTPTRGATQRASKGAEASQKKPTPSKASIDPVPTSGSDARTEILPPSRVWDSSPIRGSNRKLTEAELDSIWYHTPLDEVTQKYWDEVKAYTPFKNGNPRGKGHAFDVALPNLSEPVTESKSPWGPEEGITPTTSSGPHHLESPGIYARAKERGVAKTAKVNIPSPSAIRAPVARTNYNDANISSSNARSNLDSGEVNAINVPRYVVRTSLNQTELH